MNDSSGSPTPVRQFFESHPLPMWIFDRDSLHFLAVNDAAIARYGYTRDEFLHMTIAEIRPPEEVERLLEHQRHVQPGWEDAGVWSHRWKDGTPRFVHIVSHTIDFMGREAEVVMVYDITEQIQLHEQLRLDAIVFQSSGEGVMVTDSERRIVRVNQAFTRTTGFEADEVIGRTPRVLHSGMHPPSFYDEMWNTIRTTGYWQGEIWNRRKNGEVYPEWLGISVVRDEADGEVLNYIGIFSDITQRKLAEERIEFLAHHDPLTGLPNRALMFDRLERAIQTAQRNGTKAGIIYLDMDRFKLVNDSLGHAVGDELLQQVATRMVQAIRSEDTVCRLGGDEFIIIPANVRNSDDVARVVRTLFDGLLSPFQIRGHCLNMSFSAGISLYPDDATNADELLTHADVAMYHAKSRGRNNFQFFNAEMNYRAIERMRIEQDLRRALPNGELLLHYQPQVDLLSGAIIGVEAFVRWQHPRDGLLKPTQFGSIAEDSGLMVVIGEWALQHACRAMVNWQRAGIPPITLAVNISANQFRRSDIVEMVQRVLRETELPAHCLELELAEGVLMRNPEEALPTVRRLREIGVRLAVDDFGLAASNLSYLRRFHVHSIKIDQQFIAQVTMNADDAVIAETVIRMGESLGVNIVAEGVETREQWEFLRSHGCRIGQGYFISLPLPEDECLMLLQRTIGADTLLKLT